ncbi:MAG: hypothetical protein CL677_02860 [Bdellovibrionaceae bacterium]|nr:hypothetical protein [Pseudobdellovibrionaceae bacterium]
MDLIRKIQYLEKELDVKSSPEQLESLVELLPQAKKHDFTEMIDLAHRLAALEISDDIFSEIGIIKEFLRERRLSYDKSFFEDIDEYTTICIYELPSLYMTFASRGYYKFNSYPFMVTMHKSFNELYYRDPDYDKMIVDETIQICAGTKAVAYSVPVHVVKEKYMPTRFNKSYLFGLMKGAPLIKDGELYGIMVSHTTQPLDN